MFFFVWNWDQLEFDQPCVTLSPIATCGNSQLQFVNKNSLKNGFKSSENTLSNLNFRSNKWHDYKIEEISIFNHIMVVQLFYTDNEIRVNKR